MTTSKLEKTAVTVLFVCLAVCAVVVTVAVGALLVSAYS